MRTEVNSIISSTSARAVAIAASLGLLGAVSLASAGPAYACKASLSETEHCYAIANFENDGSQLASGAYAYVYLGCVAVPEQSTNFNDDEIWARMNNGEWMEAGITVGKTRHGDATEPEFFVGRQNALGYEEYDKGEAPVRTSNLVEIWQASPAKSSTWYGWTAGTGTITVPDFTNDYAAVDLQAGLETTTSEGWNDAAVQDLSYLNWDGDAFTTEWNNGKYHAEKIFGGPGDEGAELYWDWESKNSEADFGYKNHGC